MAANLSFIGEQMTQLMYIFPGQGSQYKGIGKDLYESCESARNIYHQASELLGYDLVELSFSDQQEQISLTRYTQPVLFTHQIACLKVFNELTDNQYTPGLLAGHSLGEYTALVAAGSISFEDGLELVSKRGELMGDFGSGSMLALPFNQVKSAALAEDFGCQVATINLQQQTVVGGTESNIDQLQEHILALHPKKRTVKLDTEGAFHTDLMKDAADEFKTMLDRTHFGSLNAPVLSNYSADIHQQDGSSTADLLYQQLYKPVNWLGCMQASLIYQIDTIIEFGGGIGKGDKPEEKRPNLEAMTKRNFRSFEHQINYYSSINTSTLNATANSLLTL